MNITVQYLEGGTHTSQISAKKAREHLHSAFEHLPFNIVIAGWDLPEKVVEACADECVAHHAELYLWYPLLVGHGAFQPDPAWRVVALNLQPVSGYKNMPEFSFICPNKPQVCDAIIYHLNTAIAKGYYRGVFLDRIRFPSPAVYADFVSQFGCFCDACSKAAEQSNLELSLVRKQLLELVSTPEGKKIIIQTMLSSSDDYQPVPTAILLKRMLTFRKQSINKIVRTTAEIIMSRGLKVALDCFSPSITPMVGQDLTELVKYSHWIKVMTYARAYGPASLPFEIAGLIDWIAKPGTESEYEIVKFLAQITGLPLPASRKEIQEGRLPSSILTEELRRARLDGVHNLFAGIELVEIEGMSQLNSKQICTDIEAILAGSPDGLSLSWDLLHIPLERLDIVKSFLP